MSPSNGLYLAIGLMSGTSLDGIDVAAIRTDGSFALQIGPGRTIPYPDSFRQRLRAVLGPGGMEHPEIAAVTRELNQRHRDCVAQFLGENNITPAEVDVVGFHGHTLHHDPASGVTCQIGDGAWLAEALCIPVVADFRSRDVAAGGEGAPLVPVYHRALVMGQPELAANLPVAVLNLGGIVNVSVIAGPDDADLLAFDIGPCNALLDDWALKTTNMTYDGGGTLALSGQVDEAVAMSLLDNAYFMAPPPKSLDRQTFNLDSLPGLDGLSPADGAATLADMVGRAAATAQAQIGAKMGEASKTWVVCGGGRKNAAVIAALNTHLGGVGDARVIDADALGWDGDAMEAEAFAYLAVRTTLDLPITFPGTTGVSTPKSGGTLFNP